jgi:hypothetical protein
LPGDRLDVPRTVGVLERAAQPRDRLLEAAERRGAAPSRAQQAATLRMQLEVAEPVDESAASPVAESASRVADFVNPVSSSRDPVSHLAIPVSERLISRQQAPRLFTPSGRLDL